jgi:hypothetical protein
MIMPDSKDAVVSTLLESIEVAKQSEWPYRSWVVSECLPQETMASLLTLPFEAPALDGVSGKRELHNATRRYFDAENQEQFSVCSRFCAAFQDPRVTDRIASRFGAKLSGTYLRVEYAQDVDGFWLEPHTDLGVKMFTMLLYISKEPQHQTLGTDIYDADKSPVGRSPFACNSAFVFVPSSTTYHGFERRRIEGVRKSIIINYVTNEWRAREQLAFPNTPIGN